MLNTLMDVARGSYRLGTASGARYAVNLDEMNLARYPSLRTAGFVSSSSMRFDRSPLRLLRIFECTVGRPAAFALDLGILGVPFTIRTTTTVCSIELDGA